jgi:hypothetical protein
LISGDARFAPKNKKWEPWRVKEKQAR